MEPNWSNRRLPSLIPAPSARSGVRSPHLASYRTGGASGRRVIAGEEGPDGVVEVRAGGVVVVVAGQGEELLRLAGGGEEALALGEGHHAVGGAVGDEDGAA